MNSYLVVSGVPGSGKSTVARIFSEKLSWPLFDKDDFLEALFKVHDCQNTDQRHLLSREADIHFQQAATIEHHAVLDSFWRAPRTQSASGTPTEWLISSEIRVLEVVCRCPADIAASRFLTRKRHSGHHDYNWTHESLMAQSRKLEKDFPLNLGAVVEFDSSGCLNIESVLPKVFKWVAA